ncbi:MAG TPA: hypothetical protein VGN10_14365 [Pyrinomonadaceae bacterium]
MSDTSPDAAKEKPINDGGGTASEPTSQPTEPQPTGTTSPESSD